MKIARWAILKIVVVSVLIVPVASHRLKSIADAQGLGLALAIGFGLLAIFQLLVWIFYDVVTMKRGGWITPQFGGNPLSLRSGPGLYLGVVGMAFLTFGFVKLLSTVVQGFPSLVLGIWLLCVGAGFLIWQRLLRWLFRRWFAHRNCEPSATDNSRPPKPSSVS